MLYEEIQKFESLTGNNANDFSISYVGGFLDGYKKREQEEEEFDKALKESISKYIKEASDNDNK